MNQPKTGLVGFHISINGRPYLGESEEAVDTYPRGSGWTGLSPQRRSRIALGEFLAGPGKLIEGRRNLRSELERILAEVDSGLVIQKIEIDAV